MAKKRLAFKALSDLYHLHGNDEAVAEIWHLAQRLLKQSLDCWRVGTDVMLLLSHGGSVLDSNGALEAHLGKPAGWAVGRTIWEMVPVGRRERVRAIIESVVALGRPVSYLAALDWGPGTVMLSPIDHGEAGQHILVLIRSLPIRLWQYEFNSTGMEDGLVADS